MKDVLKTVVIGDGWSALGAAAFLAKSGQEVCWITGTGARAFAPLASMETGPGVGVWSQLALQFGMDLGEPETGCFLREFRNKSFRHPAWVKAPTPDARKEVRDEILWSPETRFAGVFEARFSLDLIAIEEQIRLELASFPNLTRLEGVPVIGYDDENVILGSGEKIACDRVIYADRWSALSGIEGLPKGLPFNRNREPLGVLQAIFTHETPIANGEVREGFYGATHKEAGDEFQRHLWGHFLDEGKRSIWTLFLAADEVEDNHEIAKKLRRMKQTLDRMFTGSEWLPEGKADFISTVQDEQVRFEESFVFGSGTAPTAVVTLPKQKRIAFLTDGYGPSSAMHQVGMLLGEELSIQLASPNDFAETPAEVTDGAAAEAAPVLSN